MCKQSGLATGRLTFSPVQHIRRLQKADAEGYQKRLSPCSVAGCGPNGVDILRSQLVQIANSVHGFGMIKFPEAMVSGPEHET